MKCIYAITQGICGRSAEGVKILCLVLLVIVAASCVDVAAQQAAQQRQADFAAVSLKYLREQTNQHRGDCAKAKSSDDTACLLYAGDLYISDHCWTYYGQFPSIDITCAHSIEQKVNLFIECKSGNQPSCVDMQYSLYAANEQRQAQQDALQRSLVQAQWAQAQAQGEAAVQKQTRQLQLQSLPRPVTTNCQPNGLGGVNCTQY